MLVAYVDFVTEESRASAIIHTVKSGRISVLERLVALDADLSVRDESEWTPLCYASRNRDEKAVSILVQAGAALNDSSLHLAAKMAYPNIVSILLSAGHDPRYPSVVHRGRIPLACLCLESHGTGRDWELRLQQTLGLLAPQTDLKWRSKSKSLLHFALDNDHNACEVTMKFIEVSGLWRSSNLNDEYMFTDHREFFYSPTQYVKLLCYSKDTAEKYSLIELLKNFGFTDRYYAELGNQPEGAVGFPPEIQAQRKAEWEKEEVIRRQNEIAAHNRRLLDETHREALKNQREQDAHERKLMEKMHKLELESHEEVLKLQKERSDLAMERESVKLRRVENSLAENYGRVENLEERVTTSMEQLKRVLNRAKEQERSLLSVTEGAAAAVRRDY
jgi:ankyrin repeat domain-containing protein 50